MKTKLFLATLLANMLLAAVAIPQGFESKPTPNPGRLPGNILNLYKEANQSFQKKDFAQALDKLKAAEAQAKDTPKDEKHLPQHEAEAGNILLQAQVLMQEKDKLEESLKLFEKVGRSDVLGSRKQRTVAQMNAATVLMRMSSIADDATMKTARAKAAAQIMYDSDWSQIDRAQRPVLWFNYGRALEESGKPEEAVIRYARSLANDANYQPSAQRLKLLTTVLLNKDASLKDLGETIINSGAPTHAAQIAADLLLRRNLSPAREQEAVAVILRAWASDFVDSQRFVVENKVLLASLTDSPWNQVASEARFAASPMLPKDGADEIGHFFPWCTNGDRPSVRAAFATFLAATARPFVEAAGDNQEAAIAQAFFRVHSAWTLNRSDLELCQQLAWLTHDFRTQVDPQGRIRDELIRRMFDEKRQLYLLKGRTVGDWENILRMHTSLGQILEADRIWGDEETPASSIGQWTLAIKAEQRIRELKPAADQYRAPGLHEHLAKCLEAKGRFPEAFAQYVEAGRGHLEHKNALQTQRMIAAAQKLEEKVPDASSRKLLADLVVDLNRAAGSIPKK